MCPASSQSASTRRTWCVTRWLPRSSTPMTVRRPNARRNAKPMADAAVQAAAGIDVECIVEAGDWPPEDALHDICVRAVAAAAGHAEAAGRGTPTRLVSDDAATQAPSARLRGKDEPTHVLSVPA